MLRSQTDEIFQARDIEVNYSLLTGSSQIASHLVANGAGITLIDRLSTATLDPGKVVTRPLEPKRWVSFGVIRPVDGEPNPLAEKLIEYLRDEVRTKLVPGLVELPDTE